MHISEAQRQLRVINQGIRNQLSAGAVAPATYQRLMERRYEVERLIGHTGGRRVLHLACGHDRIINVATYEEADMERTGTVQCRATKMTVRGNHRWSYVGVLGWTE